MHIQHRYFMVVVATFIVESRACSVNSLWCIHSYTCDKLQPMA